MKCAYCGTELRNESNFCLGCGRPVDARACYLAELKESGKALTRKTDKDSLEHIAELTGKIFDRTDENPDLKYEARAFFEAYLPKINGLLHSYRDVKSGKGHKKEEVDRIKDDLTEVLDTTEEAFEVMYGELCENDIMQLQINIVALKAQIARDGLMRSEFDIKK